ncbi:MAG TPA: ABC transporter permease, partial [Candidatus Margulisiibacteriota bacterium]|nr:ABC transporter permease [Candidatus Margulisiibacteriota bacterium]
MKLPAWLMLHKPLSKRARTIFGIGSIVLPLLLWSVVSYVPFVWHPQILITDPGDVDYLEAGMRMDRAPFQEAVQEMKNEGKAPPSGTPSNPIYLPAPDEVATAFYTAFTTPPAERDGP